MTYASNLRTYANGILVQVDDVAQATVDLAADILGDAYAEHPGKALSWRVPLAFARALRRAENARREAQRRTQPVLADLGVGDYLVLLGVPGRVVDNESGEQPWLVVIQ